MNRRLITVLAAVTLAAGVAIAQQPGRLGAGRRMAQGARLGPGMGAGAGLNQRVLAALNLTDAQKAQVKTILEQTKQAAQPIRQTMQKSRQDLAAAVKANNTAEIQSLATALGSEQGQLMAITGNARAQIYSLLTPEQKSKLDTLQQAAKVLGGGRGAGKLR